MSTTLEIITKALQKIGAVTKSETISADDAADALSSLNAMISSWSLDSLLVYASILESFTLTAGDSSYTIGSTGDFNTSRPTEILSAYIRDNTTDTGLNIITEEEYDTISVKSFSGKPSLICYTPSYPLGTIKLDKLPDQTYTLFLLSKKPFSSYALSDDVTLPPGFERAIVYNLALELAPEYGQPLDASVASIARDSLSLIKTANVRATKIPYSKDLGVKNIFTGWY